MTNLTEKEEIVDAMNEVIVVEGTLSEAMGQTTNLAEYKNEKESLNG